MVLWHQKKHLIQPQQDHRQQQWQFQPLFATREEPAASIKMAILSFSTMDGIHTHFAFILHFQLTPELTLELGVH